MYPSIDLLDQARRMLEQAVHRAVGQVDVINRQALELQTALSKCPALVERDNLMRAYEARG